MADFDFTKGSIYFIGTATTLIRYGGLTLLTDPNFLHQGDHVHLGYGMFDRRLTNPALDIEQLPPLDLVLLSHLHGDHFDRVARKKLDRNVPIVTTRHAATWLKAHGFREPIALPNWRTHTLNKGETRVQVTSMPGRHGPAGVSALLPPVMGSMLDFTTSAEGHEQRSFRMYISGDTLVYRDIQEIPRRFPDIDLALLHLGGTRVLGVLVTMDAGQGIRMIRVLNPGVSIPIHFNDYKVFKSPLEDFKRAVDEAGLQAKVHYLAHGETYEFEVPARAATARRFRRSA